MRRGYKGLYIDDVNMIRRVALGSGQEVTPISPRTGRPISRRAWRRSVARFTRQIRRALPRAELVHNMIWFAPRPRDRYSRMQVRSANVVGLERGVNDDGLGGYGGPFALTKFLRYVDWLHRRGKRVLFDENAGNEQQREYGLAGYLLTNAGRDLLASEPGTDPDGSLHDYGLDLGAANGRRYLWKGLLRRDFERGVVLLNRPAHPTRTVRVTPALRSSGDAQSAATVTVPPWGGAVLAKPR